MASSTRTRPGSWREHALATLAAAGYRRGGARNAVVELLDRQDCALTAQEIDDRLRAQGRGVGRASVYRILELLTELRLVQRIDVGQGVARYERHRARRRPPSPPRVRLLRARSRRSRIPRWSRRSSASRAA